MVGGAKKLETNDVWFTNKNLIIVSIIKIINDKLDTIINLLSNK